MGAAAAPIAIGASIVGTGFKLYGQKKAEAAQRAALEREKQAIQEEVAFIKRSEQEQLEIFDEQTAELFGNQVSAFAANGVDFSGSALATAIDDQMKAEDQRGFMKEQFRYNRRRAELGIEARNMQIASINKMSGFNTMTTILGGIGGAAGRMNFTGGARASSIGDVSGGSASQPFSGGPDVGSIA